jgi:hypothetical protein
MLHFLYEKNSVERTKHELYHPTQTSKSLFGITIVLLQRVYSVLKGVSD